MSFRARPKAGFVQSGGENGSGAPQTEFVSYQAASDRLTDSKVKITGIGLATIMASLYDDSTVTVMTDKNAKKFANSGSLLTLDSEDEVATISDADSKFHSHARPKTGLSKLFAPNPETASGGYGTNEDKHESGHCAPSQEMKRMDPKKKTKKILATISSLDEAMKVATAKSRGVGSFSDQFRFLAKKGTLIQESVKITKTLTDTLKSLVSDTSDFDIKQVVAIQSKLKTLFGPSTFSGAINDTQYPGVDVSVKQQAKQIEADITGIKEKFRMVVKRFVF